jgi:branched-chain amino acid aminotransferase
MPASIINGSFHSPSPQWLANKSFRYGDGFFETMKWREGKLLLADDHFERFFSTARALGYQVPALLKQERLLDEITQLVKKSAANKLARIRLTAWRGEGGLLEGDDTLHYAIECWPLDDSMDQFNENGLVIGIYPEARKAADAFSRYKTNNFLAYSLAARHAKAMRWNDALLLNERGGLADSCIANLFIVKNEKIFTPPLSEGPVEGIMRRQIMRHFPVAEASLRPEDLETADEIFLSNAIRGIRWVRQLGDRLYTNQLSAKLYRDLRQTI